MEINGFEIEQFNVLGLPPKAKTAICPKCSHNRKPKNQKQKCMSVFWDTGLGHCNHCGERTQLHTYKKKVSDVVYEKPKPRVIKHDYDQRYVDYYKDHRAISVDTLKENKVGFSTQWMPKAQKEIPVTEYRYFLHGELINVKYRGKNKDFKFETGCEQIPYGMDDVLGEKWCVVVEGEEDKHSFYEAGIKNCISVPNGFTLPRNDGTSTINTSYLDRVYQVFENMEKIFLAVDNDTAGKHGEKELIRRFGADKCYLVDFGSVKDANDYLKEFGKNALSKLIDEAKQVPLEGVKTINDSKEELIDFWLNGAPKGFTVGSSLMDECASFSMAQYTLLTGAANGGKSEVLDWMLAKLAVKYKHKICICSTENKPIKFHHDKLFRKINGLRPTKSNLESDQVNECIDFINEHFYHVELEGRYFLEDVLKKFAELVKRKGCRWFVLDPYNKITLKNPSGQLNKDTAEYHNQLDEFVKKYEAHIFLVLHPTKLQLKEGSKKTFIMPTAYNIKGGGEHFDMAYNILGVVRDFELNMVQIRTLKWKFQHEGVAGVDMWYGWNLNNGRYTVPKIGFDIETNPVPIYDWDNSSWLKEMKEEKELELFNALRNITPQEAFGDDIPF